ncbi:putative CtpA-like serine protease [Paraglaciecola mesophila]|uniref:Putative CtpA-like serine protease n=1 Tax=Paraglaciecola mesophila TaxID=197222 RepID=A0A857JKQ2_9ALTE|nr:S41 family peptidase [Paraglaciecola mesophila]QHJ11868.1 putative CtpA-like serine protease [Paraglaciecola mesophila]
MIRCFTLTVSSSLLLLVSGCGGAGDSSSIEPAVTTPQTNSRWTRGLFEDASLFKDRCLAPRSGTSSVTGEEYTDVAGDSMDEKLWLRSWTNNTYLWYDEVDDNDPTNFSTIQYFEQLKTDFRTDSGSFKDNFHFSQSTEEYLTRTQSSIAFGYGISWEFIQATAPRRIIVRYTEPGSPAAQAGLERGDELLALNDIDFVHTEDRDEIDAINQILFPTSAGAETKFTLRKVSGEQIDYQLSAQSVVISPVHNAKIINAEMGDIGYLQFNSHIQSAQSQLISAFELFNTSHIDALVLDMRYNGGGLLAMASQLAYMVTGSAQTDNLTFNQLTFNNKHPNTDPVTGRTLQPTRFYSREIDYDRNVFTNNSLPSLGLNRVYILTSGATCSASEALINGLRGIDIDVVLMGDTTCGKPYGFYPTDNCGTTYFTIQFQGSNQKGFGEYSDGFIPTPNPIFEADVQGCLVEDDFNHALGTVDEGMLNAALQHLQTGQCPVQTAAKSPVKRLSATDSLKIQTSSSILDAIIVENAINQPISEPSN